ncbi:Protein of unknown function (DUF1494) [Chlamydia serpentis]|uniref:Uncharacterized protein n=1 Tax=Chlamydia serpentis TaxID=1967782 RepID=A0A2R8FC77_9CHLA|nr:DUF1494 domain-containing protein [Chlamydia serpentis]SPN73932.1 Protein of unknown function (DUF1494) [Chlamydia serpentis]
MTFTLIALLLGTLGFWYRKIYSVQQRKERIYKLYIEESRAYKQLRTLFSMSLSSYPQEPGSLFSLTFDREVYKDPKLAGVVGASLYHDTKERSLELRIYNVKEPSYFETQLLLSDITNVIIAYQKNPDVDKLPTKVALTITREPKAYPPRVLMYQFALGK